MPKSVRCVFLGSKKKKKVKAGIDVVDLQTIVLKPWFEIVNHFTNWYLVTVLIGIFRFLCATLLGHLIFTRIKGIREQCLCRSTH